MNYVTGPSEESLYEAGKLELDLRITKERITKAHAEAIVAAKAERKKKIGAEAAQAEEAKLRREEG